MKLLTLVLLFSSLVFSQMDEENIIKEIYITQNAMIFKTGLEDEDVWVVQTISRNFNLYNFKVSNGAPRTESVDGIVIHHFEEDTSKTVARFSKFRSGFKKEHIELSQIDTYGLELNLDVKEKVAMIAYLNREKFPFIESFFEKTFSVGDIKVSTTLKRPVNVLKYVDGNELIYQDDFYVYAVYPSTQYQIKKSDYAWSFRNGTVELVPTEEFLATKSISAIKSGRDWYTIKWKKLRKERKLKGYFSKRGIAWNTSGLTDSEKNLVLWWRKN